MTQYQEGQTATHPDGRKLRYTSGEWVPLTADGQATFTPRPEYGAGARELPDGTIMNGRQIIRGAQNGVSAETRGRINLSLGPAVRAQDNMANLERNGQPYNKDWGAALIDKIPDWGLLSPIARALGGADFQDYDQSVATIESSLLPIFSGLAVTDSEAKRFIRANQPQIGDNAATLAEKARNRQSVLNAAARVTNQPMPYPDIGVYGQDGYRDRNDGQKTDAAIPAAADQGGGGPRPGDVVTYSQDLAPEDTPNSLSAQGYRYEGGRWVRDRQEAAPSQDSAGYRQALDIERRNAAQRKEMRIPGVTMTSQTTAPFNDELAYLAGYIEQGAGNVLRRFGGRPIEVSADERGRAASKVYNDEQSAYEREHPARNILAQLGGAAALGPGKVASSFLGRVGQGATAGGLFGFAGGEGNAMQRIPQALTGAAIGAAATPVAERIVAPLAGRVAGGVNSLRDMASGLARRLVGREPNHLATAMSRFGQRAPQEENALLAATSRARSAGTEPTFADVMDSSGRGTIQALATRQTPAREAAREFAEKRAVGMQDRVSTQARRTISGDPRTPDQIRAEISTRRAQEADQAFGAVRNEMIQPEAEVIAALRAPATRTAIDEAAVSALNRGDSETANMLGQLVDGALDDPNGVRMTVGMADRIARTLNSRAEAAQRAGNNDTAGSLFALGERLRGSARAQVPGYDDALRAYAADSGLVKAVDLGEGFLTANADEFAAAAAALSPEERALAQAAARRAVERGGGTQGAAPGVAQRLASGREQGIRSAALLDDPAPMQAAMQAERDALQAARDINPYAGSPTAMKGSDIAGAAADAAGSILRGDVVGGASKAAMAAIKKANRGFSDQEAEALVQAVIDPAQTDALISLLAQRMNRREARNLARVLTYQASKVLAS